MVLDHGEEERDRHVAAKYLVDPSVERVLGVGIGLRVQSVEQSHRLDIVIFEGR